MAVSSVPAGGVRERRRAAQPSGRGEARSTVAMSGLRLAGKLLGLVKTLVIAAWFGASAALDAFWIAYTIPAILPGLMRGVVATAFIPGFMRNNAAGVERIDWRGLNTLLTVVAGSVVAFAVLVVVFREPIVTFMAPGMSPATRALAADLTAMMSIAVLFFGLNAIFSAVLQALHRFMVMSMESIVTNIVIIGGCVVLADRYGVRGLTVAVIAGFALHSAMLAWANRDVLANHLRPAFALRHADFREPAGHMLPLLVGYLGSVAMTIVDRMFVSTLEAGMISVLAYATMIALLPMEVFGQALMTAFYPSLSRDHASGDSARMRETHLRGLRLLVFVLLPTSAALALVAHPAVTLLLQHGEFSATAADATAITLAALALGLVGRGVNYFNFRVFHARREPWTAVAIGLGGVLLNALLDWLLIERFGIAGIAIATSAAMTASALVSTWLLQRRLRYDVVAPLLVALARIALMTLALLAVSVAFTYAALRLPLAMADWQRMLVQLAALVPGAAAFVVAGMMLGVDESRLLIAALRRRRATEEGVQ